MEAPPKSIINQPELQVYVKDFGKEPDDICFVAEVDGKLVGAVWVRVMEDYGHIGDGFHPLRFLCIRIIEDRVSEHN